MPFYLRLISAENRRPITFRYGDSTSVADLGDLVECQDCGAAVTDSGAHSRFHSRLVEHDEDD